MVVVGVRPLKSTLSGVQPYAFDQYIITFTLFHTSRLSSLCELASQFTQCLPLGQPFSNIDLISISIVLGGMCVCVCIYSGACVCLCMHTYVHVHGGQRSTSGVLPQKVPISFFETLTGTGGPVICLGCLPNRLSPESLPVSAFPVLPCKHVLGMHLAFYMDAGD